MLEEELDEAHVVSGAVGGLTPASFYRVRLFAENAEGEAAGETLLFATYPTAPTGLPDSRAYEQASPVNKDGGDALGIVPFVKAALSGNGITFGTTSGIPGGVGAQEFPTFLASREGQGEAAHWVTRGLLPPQALADNAQVLGWTPEFANVFQKATVFAEGLQSALYRRSGAGAEESALSEYVPKATYAYAGSAADESSSIFESNNAENLDPAKPGAEGRSNVYASEGSALRLASVLPNGSPAPQGAFAGPYDWARGRLNEGGADRQYYTQEERAVSEDGSLFFTSAGDGHIYRRLNPTAGEEEAAPCAAASVKACTLDVSPSVRTPPDQAGERPRAFMGASADGKSAFFTSPEELTNDANTGKEVPGPQIGRATIGAPPEEEAQEPLPEWLSSHHAIGVAAAGEGAIAGEYIYWADPSMGTIGRAKLDGSEANDEYVTPGETCAETHPVVLPGQEQCAPTAPRYVAVGPCGEEGAVLPGVECIYWTNTGPLGGDLNKVERELPAPGAGTIGRAVLGAGEGEEVDPQFITGATNPQGIAVNESHVYWVNSLHIEAKTEVDIARAVLDGGEVKQHFHELANIFIPYGVALSATRVYWTMETAGSAESYVSSIPLAGGSETQRFIDFHLKPRAIVLIGPHVYWAAQGTEAIGRIDLELKKESREAEFLKAEGSLLGLASEGSHLYWSANGEIPPHPGNDLYRFQAQGTGGCAQAEGCLTDLSADSVEKTGPK